MGATYKLTAKYWTKTYQGCYGDLIDWMLMNPTEDEVTISHEGRPVAVVYDGQVIELCGAKGRGRIRPLPQPGRATRWRRRPRA